MANFLIINAGSTSIKYKVFDENENLLLENELSDVENYEQAFKQLLRQIINLGEIKAVGHRVVHGGGVFYEPIIIDENKIQELEKFNDLAPLHNPYNILGIKTAMSYMQDITQIAVFDTAFYHRMPEIAKIYALPKEITEKYKLYRYGFHGTSHEYVMNEAATQIGKKIEKCNFITCHLGGGCSVTAIKDGKAIETTMGYTPSEGLVMMTRSGDVDPGVILKLVEIMPGEINQQKIDGVQNLINHESGIKGLVDGVENFKELISQMSSGKSDATKAFDLFIYRLVKAISFYWFLLEGKVDAIIFTGAIGSGNPITLDTVKRKLKFLGKINILAIKTNEELLILRKIKNLLK
ncbi:MAG: Acetate kinase [Parcubacteria group bacterium GW2011_GWE2_39_37]|nr:MAG: Acetate kinase [Parcubacteria group bacterium GW2011_GWE2_39_37]